VLAAWGGLDVIGPESCALGLRSDVPQFRTFVGIDRHCPSHCPLIGTGSERHNCFECRGPRPPSPAPCCTPRTSRCTVALPFACSWRARSHAARMKARPPGLSPRRPQAQVQASPPRRPEAQLSPPCTVPQQLYPQQPPCKAAPEVRPGAASMRDAPPGSTGRRLQGPHTAATSRHAGQHLPRQHVEAHPPHQHPDSHLGCQRHLRSSAAMSAL